MTNFDISEHGIYVSSSNGMKIIAYDLEGNHMKSISLDFYPHQIKLVSDQEILVKSREPINEGVYHVVNHDGVITQSYLADSSGFQNIAPLRSAYARAGNDGQVPFVQIGSTVLHAYHPKRGFREVISLDFGDYQPRLDELQLPASDYIDRFVFKGKRFSTFIGYERSKDWHSLVYNFNATDGERDPHKNYLLISEKSKKPYNLTELQFDAETEAIDAYFFPTTRKGDRFYGAAILESLSHGMGDGVTYGRYTDLDMLLEASTPFDNPFIYSFIPKEKDF